VIQLTWTGFIWQRFTHQQPECIGFWCIRHLRGTGKDGKEWKLSEKKWALCFPPLILAINIFEAVTRDFQVGAIYSVPTIEFYTIRFNTISVVPGTT